MFKLFVNGVQIGNYRNMKMLLECAMNVNVIRNGVKSIKWEGKTLIVKTW